VEYLGERREHGTWPGSGVWAEASTDQSVCLGGAQQLFAPAPVRRRPAVPLGEPPAVVRRTSAEGWAQEAAQLRVGAVLVPLKVAWKPKAVLPAGATAPL
jgi:hypothetical protein